MRETFERELIRSGERQPAVVTHEAAGTDHIIEIAVGAERWRGDGPDAFSALESVRRALEASGWLIAVEGARRDAVLSRMGRQMSGGTQVYRVRPGHPADFPTRDVFAPNDEDLATVDEQRTATEEWFASLRDRS